MTAGRRRRGAPALAPVMLSAALLAGCAGAHREPWDPDRPVLPVTERAAAAAPQAAAGDSPPAIGAVPAGGDESVPRWRAVLLPDEDGGAGQIVVSSDGGRVVVDTPWQAVDVADPDRVEPFDAAALERNFGDVVGYTPPAPAELTLLFETDSTRLTPGSESRLPALLEALAARPVPEIVVEGHSDRSGSEAYNEALSRRRAESLRDRLMAAGFDGALIDTVWYGERRPVVPTADGVRQASNRRVVLRVR